MKSKVENGEVIEKEIERIILRYFTSFFDLGEAKSSYNSRTNEYHNNIPLERAVSEMKAFITNALNQQRLEIVGEIREEECNVQYKCVCHTSTATRYIACSCCSTPTPPNITKEEDWLNRI